MSFTLQECDIIPDQITIPGPLQYPLDIRYACSTHVSSSSHLSRITFDLHLLLVLHGYIT